MIAALPPPVKTLPLWRQLANLAEEVRQSGDGEVYRLAHDLLVAAAVKCNFYGLTSTDQYFEREVIHV